MGNIAYEKAFRKQLKTSYKGLSDNQRNYVKAKELFEQMDKGLSDFYTHCKRTAMGAADFQNMSEQELDLFEHLNKQKEKAMRTMSRLEDVIDVDLTLNIFRQINTHSMSF